MTPTPKRAGTCHEGCKKYITLKNSTRQGLIAYNFSAFREKSLSKNVLVLI